MMPPDHAASPMPGASLERWQNSEVNLRLRDNAPIQLPVDEIFARVGGDIELLAVLVGLFKLDAPTTLSEIRRALDNNDAPALERAAHRLVGSLLTFHASAAAQPARALEIAGHHELLSDAEPQFAALQRELPRVITALDHLVSPLQP